MIDKLLPQIPAKVAQSSVSVANASDSNDSQEVSFEGLLGSSLEASVAAMKKVGMLNAVGSPVQVITPDDAPDTSTGRSVEYSMNVQGFTSQGQQSAAVDTGVIYGLPTPQEVRENTVSAQMDKGAKAQNNSLDGKSSEAKVTSKLEAAHSPGHAAPQRVEDMLSHLRRDFGASFADQISIRFASLRQAQKVALDSIREGSEVDPLSNAKFNMAPSVSTTNLNTGLKVPGNASAVNAEEPVVDESYGSEDLKKAIDLVIDRKKGAAEISLKLKDTGTVRLKVEIQGRDVHVTMMEHNPAAYALLKENLDQLKKQFSGSGLSLASFNDFGESAQERDLLTPPVSYDDKGSQGSDLKTIARA